MDRAYGTLLLVIGIITGLKSGVIRWIEPTALQGVATESWGR